MDIQPLSQPKENNLKHRTMQQQDYAAALTKKLNQTLIIQSASASLSCIILHHTKYKNC